MRDIGIIINRDSEGGIYTRTSSKDEGFISGEMLAKSFATNIDAEKSDLFFDCISNGIINEDQNLLPDFNLTNVSDGGEEESQLIQLLIQKDYPLRIEEDPSTLRKQTITHLLTSQFKPASFNDREFIYSAYNQKGASENKVEEVYLDGIIISLMNFGIMRILNIKWRIELLEDSYGPNWISLRQLVDGIGESVIDVLKQKIY